MFRLDDKKRRLTARLTSIGLRVKGSSPLAALEIPDGECPETIDKSPAMLKRAEEDIKASSDTLTTLSHRKLLTFS